MYIYVVEITSFTKEKKEGKKIYRVGIVGVLAKSYSPWDSRGYRVENLPILFSLSFPFLRLTGKRRMIGVNAVEIGVAFFYFFFFFLIIFFLYLFSYFFPHSPH